MFCIFPNLFIKVRLSVLVMKCQFFKTVTVTCVDCNQTWVR